MVSKQTKIILAATAIIFVLVAATVTEFYLETTQSASKPFSFSLTASPDNAAVVQGGNATITVEAAYLNGTSKPLTFSASGGPNGTTYTFLPQTLAPTKGNPLSSNLTINLPNANVSRTYAINITATTPDGMTNSTTCTLTVLNNEILIKGTVTANRWPGVYPTKIEFINVNTDQIYWVPLNTTAGSQPTAGAGGADGAARRLRAAAANGSAAGARRSAVAADGGVAGPGGLTRAAAAEEPERCDQRPGAPHG